jgi:prepilin-type N-terminal cleavage/methylation domain-containing protein
MFKSKKKGFSLMELLVVITIIAVMSMATMVMVSDQSEKAKMATAMNDFNAIATAINMVRASGEAVIPLITITDGAVNTDGGAALWELEKVESYLGGSLTDFPDEYVFSGNYIIYDDGTGVAKSFDFGDGRGEVLVRRKLL